ncbi:GNAT family N-acetyltransferase [Methylosinus sp. Sm6]|uniref:GNAT family N-acetyltransferase n=1 Tax=Methylosinus sp. Sm6 TaxID=2866948 RepID=UPI002104E485|nr:GNAT family N-acetyltransferase [Methylosinus sp. Sm6]
MSIVIRRLGRADAVSFHALRLEGFRLHEREFRFAPEDEAGLSLEDVAARLARDAVFGACDGDALVGVAGLAFSGGAKTRHKALLWGMYLRAAYRGAGVADRLMSALMDEARGRAEMVTLTVIHGNARATRFYERWGFVAYGVEPRAVRTSGGDYLDEAMMALRLDANPTPSS